MLINFLRVLPQYLAPQHLLSRLAGIITNCKKVSFKNWVIDCFIKHYAVDMTTAAQPDPHQYENFNAFFTRTLRVDARPLANLPYAISSPVDGVISQLGRVNAGRMIQAKGFHYDVQRLLGGDEERAQPFSGGSFMTIYLAPKDYHRVHIPIAATLRQMIYVPGKLFSVNPLTADTVPNLFSRNERVAMLFDTAQGPMAVVMVGAMLVASMHIAWEGVIAPSSKKAVRVWDYAGQNKHFAQGDELGYFQLGSTVIVLFGADSAHWLPTLQAGEVVRYGQLLGHTETTVVSAASGLV